MDKIKVKFLRPVTPYRTGDIWFLRPEQFEVLSHQGMVEKVEEKKKKAVKKAKNKAVKSENVENK